MRLRLAHEREQPADDLGAGLGASDRPELRRADGDDASHDAFLLRARTSSAERPTMRR